MEEIKEEAEKKNIKLVSIKQLIDEGIIKYFDGNGSPKSDLKEWEIYHILELKIL